MLGWPSLPLKLATDKETLKNEEKKNSKINSKIY